LADLSRFFGESPRPPSGGVFAGISVGGASLTVQATGSPPAVSVSVTVGIMVTLHLVNYGDTRLNTNAGHGDEDRRVLGRYKLSGVSP
jgi:hypothetical protein